MKDIADTVSKGIVCTCCAVIAAVSVAQEQVAWALGVVVATFSAVSLAVDLVRKLKRTR